LLLVPEHTWGMDLKRYLPDYLNYRKKDFIKARKQNIIPAAVVREGAQKYLPPKDTDTNPVVIPEVSYSQFEASWKEQRDYISTAIECLSDQKLLHEAHLALEEVKPVWIPADRSAREGYCPIRLEEPLYLCNWEILFNASTGSISSLKEIMNNLNICQAGGSLGLYRYEIYSHKEYKEFYSRYLIQSEDHYDWSLPDYTKPGLELLGELAHTVYFPEDASGYMLENQFGCEIRIYAKLPNEACTLYGAPREILTRYVFSKKDRKLTITHHWHKKDANRIPESSWLDFNLNLASNSACLMDKMGNRISPGDVVKNGNRALHAVGKNITCQAVNTEGQLFSIVLESRDAPLVSIGKPRILQFDQSIPDCREGLYFNLHNNLWGTNFPMWYSEDGMFQFTLTVRNMQ
jgi:hypothetical protein